MVLTEFHDPFINLNSDLIFLWQSRNYGASRVPDEGVRSRLVLIYSECWEIACNFNTTARIKGAFMDVDPSSK